MSKRNKIIMVSCIICTVIIVCAGYFFYWYEKESKYWSSVDREESIDELLYVEINQNSGDICIVKSRKSTLRHGQISPDGYVYMRNFIYKYKERNGIYDIKIKKSQLDVYDLGTREKIKSYDLGDIVEQYAPDSKWYGDLFSYQTKKGDLYFMIRTRGKEKHAYANCIYINFETDKITVLDPDSEFKEVDEVMEECDRNYNTNLHYLLFEDEIGLMKANGLNGTFLKNDTDKGYWCIEIDKDILPEENSILYSKFPGLKDYRGEDGERVYICLMEEPTPEEVVTMLLEEGEEISFEGCVLPAESSIDGQEHEIHSFEEYEQWKKYEE